MAELSKRAAAHMAFLWKRDGFALTAVLNDACPLCREIKAAYAPILEGDEHA